ncbi:MAG: tail fiber domain-containing protein [Flavobacteriales bacterium]|nr:tail fiber domain-containing protein [Flavobacteriales bacterium]
MNKNVTLVTLISLLFFWVDAGAQVGIGTSTPDASAVLELTSTTRGILITRVTMAQRNAIVSPATGLLIYQTDNTPAYYYNSGTPGVPIWVRFFSGSSAGGWDLSGNSGTTVGTNFLGTTDAQDLAFYTNNAERIRVDIGGNVGIGTTAPSKKLQVEGAILSRNADGAGNDVGRIYGGIDNNDYIEINSTGTVDFMSFWVNSEAMRITTSGNVGIGTATPTHKLHINGTLKSNGIVETSDVRLKKEITPLTDALAKVMALRGVTYKWKDEKELLESNIPVSHVNALTMSQEVELGVIAQEVEAVVPELVNTDIDGYKAVSYSKISALLIEALKEQQKIIQQQKEDLKDQESRIDVLEKRLSVVYSALNLQKETIEEQPLKALANIK